MLLLSCKGHAWQNCNASALCQWLQDYDNALKLAAGPAQRDVVYQEMGADAAANGDWKAAGALKYSLHSLLQLEVQANASDTKPGCSLALVLFSAPGLMHGLATHSSCCMCNSAV
jgi:hypothetical protein